MFMTIEDVLLATGGHLLAGRKDVPIAGISTDSRTIKAGELFIALTGEKFDGHRFVTAAAERGAAGALISRGIEGVLSPGFTLIGVDNTLKSLAAIATMYRQRFSIPVIGITGSVGKTSTKDMVAAVVAECYRILKNEGNLNNEIGLPLTLFRLNPAVEMAIVEMGMSSRGEIARLAAMAKPQVGIITNIRGVHLENLGTLENIARAKAELLEALPGDGLAILNADDEWCNKIKDWAHCPVVTFGLSPAADFRAEAIESRGEQGIAFTLFHRDYKPTRIELPVPGRHVVPNALAAVAVGHHFGLSVEEISKGLSKVRLSKMRMEIFNTGEIKVINDAYNASPTSMEAALDVLAELASGRKVAVLGDMLELGAIAEEAHREVGRKVLAIGISALVTVGPLSRFVAEEAAMIDGPVYHVATVEEVWPIMQKILQPGDTVLVKGSRGIHLEKVVERLRNL